MAVAVSATIDGGNANSIAATGVTVGAADTANISAEVLAGSVGAAIGGETGTSIAIGVSFARNSISDPVTAYISDVPTLTSVGGDVSVTAQEGGSIESNSAAVAFSVGIGGESGLAVGGGGALAANFIEAETQAYIYGSTVNTSGAPAGNVVVTATDNSVITAETLAIAASLGIGGESGTAVAIGVSLAYNEIGDATGFGSGQITADISNSAINANGQVQVTATSSGSIEALTASVAGALSGGGESGIAVAGAGVGVFNSIEVGISAYISPIIAFVANPVLGDTQDVQLASGDTVTLGNGSNGGAVYDTVTAGDTIGQGAANTTVSAGNVIRDGSTLYRYIGATPTTVDFSSAGAAGFAAVLAANPVTGRRSAARRGRPINILVRRTSSISTISITPTPHFGPRQTLSRRQRAPSRRRRSALQLPTPLPFLRKRLRHPSLSVLPASPRSRPRSGFRSPSI